ncbi:hypothetical protein [Rhizobium mongolense]|uniref:Uncharacterized protein n=2 Tax=Rhizobium mongolense TaxID=57676 RepID=A0ABR6IQN4_9HYPH|nr:hypothetical protein [Rhizobium mongolense]MBB4230068.1 hypothetical protein [Rhizobium mongolense]TVZ72801.1 hypothetical protein BCL32_0988 [Rhizobium mongolense USDA 1844]
MELRHENELMNRLERVEILGCAEILREELKRWYGADRIGVNVWRDLHDRWKMIEQRPEMKLLVGGTDSSNWVFIWGEGLATGEASWFKDVAFLARRTNAQGRVVELLPPDGD